MERVHKISLALWLCALLVFYWAHHYYIYLLGSETKLAAFIAWFTALFNEPEYSAPSWTTQGFSMYEERAIQVFFVFAILLCILALSISTYKALKRGFGRVYYQICLLSTFTIGCIIYVAFTSGVAYA